ncbi:enolase C-terminal domain-like protein [Acuticoccus sp. MNP-M23]|uniref:enolase C-terminal domain-like protein n=1 Tax=Acuticoccus sp. MNP-M23 TaxID=3072793 RepID=UPI0028164488|nr:enolase C-terminal domain-like protein [Acuticoccus sp. MNP-M23]WMS43540.1 enolase C-terminal domain-like protein [Acuticoccus sp. MNP-M23]
MQLDVFTVHVSDKTDWIVLRLTGPDGWVGIGEATLNRETAAVLAAVEPAAAAAAGATSAEAARMAVIAAIDGAVGRAIASGLEQAALDLSGRRTGLPVHALLGGAFRHKVPAYANINRGTLSRTPQEFAARARKAASAGYTAVKLAPFDAVTAAATDDAAREALLADGLSRIRAVTQAVPSGVGVQIDCHSRFRADEAAAMLEAAAGCGVSWFEEPVAETAANRPALAALRPQASALGVVTAGAESAGNLAEFLPFVVGGTYDIVMPDIILAGGPREVVRIGHLAAAFGVGASLHNPCGPVMDMASANTAAAMPTLVSLERQFDESALYDEIVAARAHNFQDGAIGMTDAPGLGIRLDFSHPALVWQASHAVSL